MLKHAGQASDDDRPDIKQLLERLAAETRSWAESEIALARAEVMALKMQLVRAILLAGVGLAAGFCALVAFSLAAIAVLVPYVSQASAALIVGGVLLLLAAALGLAIRSALVWETDSVFFRWFGRRPSDGAGS